MKTSFNLLALGMPATIALIAVAAVVALLVVIGFIRRFSKMSWVGWQIAIVFCATLLIGKIPVLENKLAYVAILAGGLFGVIAIVLMLGGLLRAGFRARRKKANWFFRILDRVAGALTLVVNVVVPLLAVGGFVLSILYHCTALDEGILFIVYNICIGGFDLWAIFGTYAMDLMIVAFFVFVVKGGYKLGLMRTAWTVVMMILTVGALAGAVIVAIKVPFVANFSLKLQDLFVAKMNPTLAMILGYGVVALVVFIVLVLAIVLLNLLINLGVRELDHVKVIRFLDGGLFSIVVFVIAAAVAFGIYFAVSSAVGGYFGELVQTYTSGWGLEELFSASPLTKIFYDLNPILILIGRA
ncbi:MAG: hypothetical protein J6C93_00525 [Clostridia bacterium]|nr:hypothetical protein [Clostridia bacterium]